MSVNRIGMNPSVTLSTAQLAALALLAKRRCYTAYATYGDMNISGRAAKSRVGKGLARYVRGWEISGNRQTLTVVEITDAGKKALEGQP